jgi:hypothetical protein
VIHTFPWVEGIVVQGQLIVGAHGPCLLLISVPPGSYTFIRKRVSINRLCEINLRKQQYPVICDRS